MERGRRTALDHCKGRPEPPPVKQPPDGREIGTNGTRETRASQRGERLEQGHDLRLAADLDERLRHRDAPSREARTLAAREGEPVPPTPAPARGPRTRQSTPTAPGPPRRHGGGAAQRGGGPGGPGPGGDPPRAGLGPRWRRGSRARQCPAGGPAPDQTI